MSNNRYITEGELEWQRVQDMLTDITDGYLSNVQGVEYQNASGANGLLEALAGDSGTEATADVVGSRLLKSISRMHGIVIDFTIKDKPEDDVLHRLSKFATVASNLSDEYAMKDRTYRQQFHDDVLEICEAVRSAQSYK
jgi:hypothetical protein